MQRSNVGLQEVGDDMCAVQPGCCQSRDTVMNRSQTVISCRQSIPKSRHLLSGCDGELQPFRHPAVIHVEPQLFPSFSFVSRKMSNIIRAGHDCQTHAAGRHLAVCRSHPEVPAEHRNARLDPNKGFAKVREYGQGENSIGRQMRHPQSIAPKERHEEVGERRDQTSKNKGVEVHNFPCTGLRLGGGVAGPSLAERGIFLVRHQKRTNPFHGSGRRKLGPWKGGITRRRSRWRRRPPGTGGTVPGLVPAGTSDTPSLHHDEDWCGKMDGGESKISQTLAMGIWEQLARKWKARA